jgi:two-component system chemotaxis response regulator CheB
MDGPTPPSRFPVVGLAGSVGGLRAITAVLEALPADLPAAVLVLIHQEPERESHLTEILARRSRMPVTTAQDGAPLRPGHVLVIPPGRHLLVTPERRTAIIISGVFPPNRPSADLLFATLATATGPDAIAVVLTGHGHDGATGATAVHTLGGTVVATDEATSEVFAMPEATIGRDHAVDHVVAETDLPPLLVRLVAEHAAAG